MEPFIVKHYSSDERPTIKGNGFDGLEIGDCREEAEEFIEFVNNLIESLDVSNQQSKDRKNFPIDLQDLYDLKRTGKTAEFDTAFADYCWQEIGRII